MANKRSTPKYIYDMPYYERTELCKILDQNDKWEELGGIYMNFDVLTIQTLRREIQRGNSPTDELLTKWGHQNHTILELFVLLSKMQHYQAMLVIKSFVDPEYHKLIYEGEQNLCRLFKEKQNSKLNCADCINKKTSQSVNNENLDYQNYANNISVNFNFPKPQNNLPNKTAFIDKTVNCSEESKIINGEEAAFLDIHANRDNAQTVAINKDNFTNKSKGHAPKFLQPEAPKDKNISEMSSIAESVGILPVITFKELELATNGWDSSTILGKGGFGSVYKGTWKNTDVAIKRTRNSETDENHSVQIQQILGELKMLNSYRHDNILPLYGFSMDGEDPCLIYQYMPNGSLEDRLLCKHGTRPLTWPQRHNIALGTARGIQFLHTIGEKPLIHGDIKSANILLDSNFEAKIGDFGLAREGPYNHYTHMKVSRVHGTRPYLPDEFLRHKKFSTKVDTHSFGIVLFELATGLRAYEEQRQHKFLKDLVENTHPNQLGFLIDKKCGPDEQMFLNLIELGKCCVRKKPKERPEMVVVLQELNAMAIKRGMLAKVQSMIRQNSLNPLTPFEMQVLHDHLSQQRKMTAESSNANNFRTLTRAVSPLTPIFHPDLNPISNAASLEAQVAFNANLANNNNNNNNNPFLLDESVKTNLDTKNKPVQALGSIAKKDTSKKSNKQTDSGATTTKENQDTDVREMKSPTPVISVLPPSASQSSVSSENPITEALTETQTQEDLDYEYSSNVENFLPLISALGVKGKSEENKNESNENNEKNQLSCKNVGSAEVTTSAKGKLLWILDDSC